MINTLWLPGPESIKSRILKSQKQIYQNQKGNKAATWFKPIQEDKRPATPEPERTIPPNDFPEPENNWANAYATSYQVPTENKLQRKTYDIGLFIKWFCRRTGKKKLCKADLEGSSNSLNIYEPLPLGGPQVRLKVNAIMTLVQLMVSYIGGSEERNFTSTTHFDPHIEKHSKIPDGIPRTIRAWRLGNGQKMTRGGAKTSSQRSRKDYRSGGSFEVWKALLGGVGVREGGEGWGGVVEGGMEGGGRGGVYQGEEEEKRRY
ncbi:hypothetical protein Tco_0313264 [Tanacetum coccineum]